jgi:predicted N-formylglutamate amidohydrolase
MTVPVHGDARGLDSVLIEVRNDLLRSPEAVSRWAGYFAPLL